MSRRAVWRTGKGRVVFVDQMSNSHLVNTIWWVRRNAWRIRSGLRETLLTAPKDAISQIAYEEGSSLLDACPLEEIWEPYRCLLVEARRRKLTV